MSSSGSVKLRYEKCLQVWGNAKGIYSFELISKDGLDIPFSCEAGVCGTCLARVIEGTSDHRDAFFTDDERSSGNQFSPYCSRSKSSVLVLDI